MKTIERELPPREHQDGCPQTRIETSELRRPDGTWVAVVRCLECAGQTVYPITEEAADGQED